MTFGRGQGLESGGYIAGTPSNSGIHSGLGPADFCLASNLGRNKNCCRRKENFVRTVLHCYTFRLRRRGVSTLTYLHFRFYYGGSRYPSQRTFQRTPLLGQLSQRFKTPVFGSWLPCPAQRSFGSPVSGSWLACFLLILLQHFKTPVLGSWLHRGLHRAFRLRCAVVTMDWIR